MDWKDACKKLQEEGLKFDFYSQIQERWFSDKPWIFTDAGTFHIAAQPIPDREDWREWCRDMQSKGVRIEKQYGLYPAWGRVSNSRDFESDPITNYRIPAQPIPAGIEKYLEEEMHEEETTAKLSSLKVNHNQDKPEIPHRELQIQWHEDMLHHLRTGEPMRKWEYRLLVGDGEWKICNDPHFSKRCEYRRRPRTVTYWHCAVRWGGKDPGIMSSYDEGKLLLDVSRTRSEGGMDIELGPVLETTVDLED